MRDQEKGAFSWGRNRTASFATECGRAKTRREEGKSLLKENQKEQSIRIKSDFDEMSQLSGELLHPTAFAQKIKMQYFDNYYVVRQNL